jgi:hypothetical protein
MGTKITKKMTLKDMFKFKSKTQNKGTKIRTQKLKLKT